jgi:hypothetical protein
VTIDFTNISVSYDALCICEGKADDISILTAHMEWQTVLEDYLQLSAHDSADCKSFFLNPVLFAICTSTFSKLCTKTHTVACRRMLTSTPL